MARLMDVTKILLTYKNFFEAKNTWLHFNMAIVISYKIQDTQRV